MVDGDKDTQVYFRFAQLVADGHFQDSQVFLGIVETQVLAEERKSRGTGMQNFKFPPAYREMAQLMYAMSPRVHRHFASEFYTESQRSIR